MDAVEAYKKRRDKRMDDRGMRWDDEEGRWVTTEKKHKIHINSEGEPDKGNPHVLEVMKIGGKGTGRNVKGKVGNKRTNYRNVQNSARNRFTGSDYVGFLKESQFGKEKDAPTMEDDMKRQGYEMNGEGRWENKKKPNGKKQEDYKEIFGWDFPEDKITNKLKDEVSLLRRKFGDDAKIVHDSPWDNGEYKVNGQIVGIDNRNEKYYGDAFYKYYDYEDFGDKRVWWDKENTEVKKGKTQGTAYEKFPVSFRMGGRKYASPEETKQVRETVSRFMKEAKEGDVYEVGGGVGSKGGQKFKVTTSRGKPALAWESEDGYYRQPVEMSRANVEKFISNGAKKVK